MANTTFAGPVRVGKGETIGVMGAYRSIELPVTAVANTDFVLQLPKCQILGFRETTRTAYTGATVTISVGNTVGGAQLISAADIKSQAYRNMSTVVTTGVPLLDWPGGPLYVRVIQTTPTAVGEGRFYCEYLPLEDGAAA